MTIDERMRSLVAVSRAVTEVRSLHSALSRICKEAAHVADAESASVLLTTSKPPDETGFYFRTGGRFGLSRAYRTAINDPTGEKFKRKGVSTLALETGKPVMVEDTETDRVYRPWRELARIEAFRSAIVIPLRSAGVPLGTLEVYRARPGPWDSETVQFLEIFSEQAIVAIQTSRLITRQSRQLNALERMVSALRAQRHEHTNHLHTMTGLLALDDHESLRAFVARVGSDHTRLTSLVGSIQVPSLAGLFIAQSYAATRQKIDVTLSAESALTELPPALDETDGVTILGNLLQNAVEAVADAPPARRKIEVEVIERPAPRRLGLAVRDWGDGIGNTDPDQLLQRGWTSKRGHDGLGLALVAEAVTEAGGTLTFEAEDPGVRVIATIPYA